MRRAWRARAALVVVLVASAAGCNGGPRVLVVAGPAQGTTYSVQVVTPPRALSQNELRAAMRAELDAVDVLVSTWRSDSIIALFNRAPAGEWFAVPSALAELAQQALTLTKTTGGAFDITLKPVLALWGFGPDGGPPRRPEAEALARALACTGAGQIAVRAQPPALRRARACTAVELAAIAQGYTVDRLAQRLRALGADRFLVEVGGELYASGRNAQGRPWQIGIERPWPGDQGVVQVIGVSGAGVSTSGDYRNHFVAGGRRYSHILDPATGRPVGHGLHSVTVVHPRTATADAYATALLVMGPERGPAFARAQGLAALFVSGAPGAATVTRTPAFKALFVDRPGAAGSTAKSVAQPHP